MSLTGRSRKQLRDDTIARIKAAATAAGSKVYGGRSTAHDVATLPVIDVYISGETALRRTYVRPPEFEREMEVLLHCLVTGSTDAAVDDALDSLIDAVLSATVGDRDWGDTNEIEMINGYQVDKDVSTEGEIRIMRGSIRIRIRAEMGQYNS